MFLTTKTKYAVMAMVEVAINSSESSNPIKIATIAEKQNIEITYLEQIFTQLRRSGLVNSVRGPGGGYKLSKPSCTIAISDIVKAVSESIKMTRCSSPSKGCMKNHSRCYTHKLWHNLENRISDYLQSTTLADVITNALEV